MPSKKGDFILIEYVAKVKETGEVFDTTDEETAKKERLYKEGEIYEPKLIVTGEGWVLKELDDNLLPLVINKSKEIEISPEKAFGPRDPEKLRMVPLRRLRDKGITPKLGAHIEYEKKLATIRTVGAGRVQLDFNPPLAGKTLVYKVTVKKKLKTPEDKISALIHRRIPLANITSFDINIGKTKAAIRIPEEAFYIEGLQIAKRGIASDLQRFFPSIATVEFVETFKFQREEPPSKAPKQKKAAVKRKKAPVKRTRRRKPKMSKRTAR